MLNLSLFLSLFFLINCSDPKLPKDTFEVVSISDGDSFTVLQNSRRIRVRINAIDAPEQGMPFGKASKQHLSKLIHGQNVKLAIENTDRYGRWVAHVSLNGRDIAAEMIKRGMAWHYKHHSSDPKLAQLELSARKNRVGLWRDENPVAPWKFRQSHRRDNSAKHRIKHLQPQPVR